MTRTLLARMRATATDLEEMVRHDIDFHRAVVGANGNASLSSSARWLKRTVEGALG